MKSKIKILALSYYFPPMASAQSIQILRIIANLDASVVVLCGDDAWEMKDETIITGIEHPLEHIIRLPFRPFNDKLPKFLEYRLRRYVFPRICFPDPQRTWIKQAGKYLWEWKNKIKYKPDLLMTFGTPMSDHLFGLEFKKRTGIPWVAHFSDPWADNPFNSGILKMRVNRRLERHVISMADAVIFTSPETVDLVMKKYHPTWRNKVFYVPHSYDSALFDEAVKPPEDRYVIRFIGNFYGARSPGPFFEALEVISRIEPGLLENIYIEFIGSLCIHKELLEKYPVARRIIRIAGTVSYIESLRLMQTAHCLFVIDAPAELSVFFPSKLVEYLGAGRFIFAISPKGATERILNEVGGLVADPSDVKAIVNVITNVLRHRPGSLPLPAINYEKKKVAEEIMKIIKNVLERS
ncbi:MAG: glycosyltransferase [Nitrospirae bacterium]|nr:glycosyltransferase [Nitrospirota bacterium]